MGAYFKSEYLKIKHTFIEKLIFIAPLIAIALSFVLTTRYFAIDSYNWWYTMLFPGTISILCTSVASKDKKMKNMAVLSMPLDLKKVWIAKILVCVCMISFAVIVQLIGTVFIGNVLGIGAWRYSGSKCSVCQRNFNNNIFVGDTVMHVFRKQNRNVCHSVNQYYKFFYIRSTACD